MAQYMLLLHQNPGTNAALPAENFKEIVQRYYAWAEKLRQQGKYVGGEKLAAGRLRHIRMRDGKPLSSDGPYAEAKDLVAGFIVVEANDLAEAVELSTGCPMFDGGGSVEVRPVMKMNP